MFDSIGWRNRKCLSKVESIADLEEGWKVPLINGNYGLYEKGAKYDFLVGYNYLEDMETKKQVFEEDIDWEATSNAAGIPLDSIDDLKIEGIDIVILKNGHEAMFWEEKYEVGLAIWDLDANVYVPIEMIDWNEIKENQKSIIKGD